MAVDTWEMERQQMAEQAACREQVRKKRLAKFRGISLGLGEQGLTELVQYRDAFQEALVLAADEWVKCRQLEEQIGREKARLGLLAARLAASPRVKAPATMADIRANEERLGLESDVESSKAEIVSMENLAKQTRTELESFTKTRRK